MLAITDHDTIGGVAEARAAAERHPINVVAGVEFSARARRGQTHVLGYGINVRHAGLIAALAELRAGREERGAKIVGRLGGLGIELPQSFFEAARAGESPGRPHIARGLVEIGMADSVQDAFDR